MLIKFFIQYQVKFVEPLLRSPVVSEVAYETMVKLARCTASPLCNWALDIATALRLIVTEEVHVLLELIPSVGEGETNERPSLGLFERIISGLSVSCKSGPLPVDSFTFVFPVTFPPHRFFISVYGASCLSLFLCCQIMERILLSSKKTGLHDDVLQILYLHMDPILPLPRLRMLSVTSLSQTHCFFLTFHHWFPYSFSSFMQVLYHALGVVPTYQASIGPALNELCLGLQSDEVAPVSAELSPFCLCKVLLWYFLNLIICIFSGSLWSLCQGCACKNGLLECRKMHPSCL